MPEESERFMNAISMNTVQMIIDYIEDNIFERLIPNLIAEQFYLSASLLKCHEKPE